MIARAVVVALGLAFVVGVGGCGHGKSRPTSSGCVDCCTDGGACHVDASAEAEDAGTAAASDADVRADLDAAPDSANLPEADGSLPALDGGFLALPEAEAWCAFQAERALATQLRALRCGAYPSATTEATVRAEVAAMRCDYVPYELGTGTMRVHRENMLACLSALATDSCNPVPGICYRDLVGTVERGGACHMEVNTSVECAPGLHCDLSKSCPGECVDDVPVGSSAAGRCQWGVAERVDGVCTALLREGESCDPQSGPSCGFFLECMADTLTCAPRRTVAVGEACRGGESVDCPIHASCGSSGLCEALADVGEPCDRSCAWGASCSSVTGLCSLPRPAGGECGDFTGCDQTVRTQCKRNSYASPGICQPYKARGEACSDPFDCDLGLSCIATSGAPAVCTGKLRDGSACQSTQDCFDTSFCAKSAGAGPGTCTRLKLAGEPCNSVFECSTVSCDQGTCACSTPRVLGFD